MRKKYLIIGFIVMILIMGSLIFYNGLSNNDVFHVGEIKFQIPGDYKYAGLNKEGNPTITNGKDSIYFTYFNKTNVTQIVKDYVNERQSNNITIIQSNFTVNNIIVYKTLSSQGASHYWFLYNGKTYSIYTWKETFNIDNIVINLVNSIN